MPSFSKWSYDWVFYCCFGYFVGPRFKLSKRFIPSFLFILSNNEGSRGDARGAERTVQPLTNSVQPNL